MLGGTFMALSPPLILGDCWLWKLFRSKFIFMPSFWIWVCGIWYELRTLSYGPDEFPIGWAFIEPS